MPDLKPLYPKNAFTNIVLQDIPESEKIALLKEELKETPFDPTSLIAADLLHESVFHGQNEVLVYLITQVHIDVNIRSTTPAKRTPACNAARNGPISTLKELIKLGADDSLPDALGWYPLHLATSQGHIEIIKYLVEKRNADINQRMKNEFGTTPFLAAVNNNKLDAMQVLVALGADHRLLNLKNASSLDHIKTKEHNEIFSYLIKELGHHDLYTSTGAHGIHLAAEFDFAKMIKYFVRELKIPIDLRTKNKYGNTPFHIAVAEGSIDALKQLIELGADHRLLNSNGANSLDHMKKEMKSVFIFLMDKLKHHDLFTLYGSHAIHLAARFNLPDTIEDIVKQTKIDINMLTKDECENTAFHIAVINGSLDALKKLVELGANYHLPSKKVFYPIHLASHASHEDILEYLIDTLRIDINQKSKTQDQRTALINSIIHNNIKQFFKLIELKADINIRTNKGLSLLHTAALNKRDKIVTYLLDEQKVEVNPLHNIHPASTPLTLAINEQSVSTTRRLIERNALISPELKQSEGLKKIFNEITHEDKPKNEALVYLAMQDERARETILQCAIEKNLTWLTKALYHPTKSESKGDITESEMKFLVAKNVMYYEVLHVEDIAKNIQIMLAHNPLFLKLPNVLFDWVFDFIFDGSLAKTKPSVVLKAMPTQLENKETKDSALLQASFFRKLAEIPTQQESLKRKFNT